MKNIAIITARGGSKRIPKKNIKEFMGKQQEIAVLQVDFIPKRAAGKAQNILKFY